MRSHGALGSMLIAAMVVVEPARAQVGEPAGAAAPAPAAASIVGTKSAPPIPGAPIATPAAVAPSSARRDTKPDSIPLGRRAPDPTARALEASLADGLLERERELHLGRGALVSAALATPVREELPSGEAVADLAVDVDAGGVVRGVRVLGNPRARDAWARVAAAVSRELERAPLGGHFGPNGARLTLRVVLTKRYPSGHDKLVELKGLGLVFDIADFGASKRRQVRAWITGERALSAAEAHALPAPAEPSRAPDRASDGAPRPASSSSTGR